MRIDSIDLIRFGHFVNREIEFPLQNPDYHLVYGDNEAGKSTQTLVAWAMRKFKRFKRHKVQASQFLQRLATECADLFVHWQIGMTGVFA